MVAHAVGDLPALVVTLLGVWGVMPFLGTRGHWPKLQAVPAPAKSPRPLKPNTGADCPRCQGRQPAMAISAPTRLSLGGKSAVREAPRSTRSPKALRAPIPSGLTTASRISPSIPWLPMAGMVNTNGSKTYTVKPVIASLPCGGTRSCVGSRPRPPAWPKP